MTLRVETRGAIAQLTFDRANKLNALSRDLLREIPRICTELNRDDQLKVVAVRGEGRAFSAGFDLHDFANPEPGLTATAAADLGRLAADALAQLNAVTVAAIQGHCAGGGVVLAAACDLRIASTDARFSIPEIDLGIPLAWGGIPLLVRELGPARTRELVMTGSEFSGAEALEWGFLNRLVEPTELNSTVAELAELIASKPLMALRATKSQVRIAADALVSTRHADADAVLLAAAEDDDEARAIGRSYLARRR